MTVGESIQKHRKNLGLSQEELGKKLLVSRQTISLWEKDQTVPTIDNLIRLREVFDISVDEILGFENENCDSYPKPNEEYKFSFTKADINNIYSLQRKALYKKPVVFALSCIFLIIFFISTSAPYIMTGFAFGTLFIGSVYNIKVIRAYNKTLEKSIERVCESTYEYKIFEDYIIINIYRKNEKVRESKCCYADIEKIQQLDKWLLFIYGGQSFILRKEELKENSVLFSYMYNNPLKTTESSAADRLGIISNMLYYGSLLSILIGITLVGFASKVTGLFIENMWLFFLLTPIPITSVVFGFILKSKGYKHKKNIIFGIVMTFILCIYGCFTFMFQ